MGLNVYLADDHTMFVQTVAAAVKSFQGVDLVKYTTSGRELLELIKEDAPDVVVLDYEMPKLNGLQTAERIFQINDEIKVILLSMFDSEELISTALEQGIHAFLLKNTEPSELEIAINKVYYNDFYHNEVTTKALRNRVSGKAPLYANISKREREVLVLVCEELTMVEIAERLFLSEKTVQNHRQNMIKKLQVRNTAGLVKKAIEYGIYVL